MFGNWSKGSNIKTDTTSTNNANIFAALEHIDPDKRPSGNVFYITNWRFIKNGEAEYFIYYHNPSSTLLYN